jgi:uncharacterized protein (TIGR02246 family)
MRLFGRGLRDKQRGVAIAPDDGRAIRELIDAWIAASKARDLPALLAMMTDDVVFMTPGRAPFGKAEFAADSERMKGVAVDARVEVLEIEAFGPRAYVRSRIGAIVTSGGKSPERPMAGYAMSILRKEPDGRWRIARDANLVMPV